jgi:hypothetical protein
MILLGHSWDNITFQGDPSMWRTFYDASMRLQELPEAVRPSHRFPTQGASLGGATVASLPYAGSFPRRCDRRIASLRRELPEAVRPSHRLPSCDHPSPPRRIEGTSRRRVAARRVSRPPSGIRRSSSRDTNWPDRSGRGREDARARDAPRCLEKRPMRPKLHHRERWRLPTARIRLEATGTGGDLQAEAA